MCVGLGQPIQDKFTASGTNKMVTLATQRKFREALRCAARWHAQQFRKGTKVPYIAHLLGVASLVLEDGGNTNQAIAALLHQEMSLGIIENSLIVSSDGFLALWPPS